MSDETNNELLSAYLDGELSADERRRVEQLLAESAECRQVYEELRALRASLASLPRRKLDDDLGPKVLRIAEQAKLSKENEAGGMSAAERRSRLWRAIVYPVLAVAAAVAMMLNSAKEKDKLDHQIARAPIKQAPAEMSAPAVPESESDASALNEDRPPGDVNGDAGYFAKSDAKADFADRQKALTGKDPGQNSESSAASTADSDSVSDVEYEQGTDTMAPSGSARPMVAGAAGPAVASAGRKAGSRSSPAMLVVTCKLASTAIQNKAFDAMLARNHLVPQPAPERLAKKAPEDAYESAERSDRLNQVQREHLELDAQMAEPKLPAGRDGAWSQSVVVELDAQQLVAVLADLQNHPDQFLSVELPGQKPEARKPASRWKTNNSSSEDLETGDDGPLVEPAEGDSGPKLKAALDESKAEPGPAVAGPGPGVIGSARGADKAQKGHGMARPAAGPPPERLRVMFRLSAAAGN